MTPALQVLTDALHCARTEAATLRIDNARLKERVAKLEKLLSEESRSFDWLALLSRAVLQSADKMWINKEWTKTVSVLEAFLAGRAKPRAAAPEAVSDPALTSDDFRVRRPPEKP